ncbi:MAG: twin-arginine translocase subunit TatC [Actinobacteria bacterium]|nr:MAG: twin-arginine translocase subunit TatC [Actinomycetota bacterium]
MPLAEHLRELRRRIGRSALAILLLTSVGWVYYDQLIAFLASPMCDLNEAKTSCGSLYINGVLGPLNLQLKVALTGGVILAAPIWLYQLWAYLAPGLHRREKKWAIIFTATATPLFAAGAYLSYVILPQAIKILMGFTPGTLNNLIKFDDYLDFVLRMILVFGISFELPLVMIALSLANLLTVQRMLAWWRGAVFCIFLFVAIFTPTGDPLTMVLLAAPLIVLYFLAVFVSWIIERRRGKRAQI